ncbi:hypothetical protein AVEN_218973-1 [Araneus ventricosus]|uniref:Uncharacterized protein n=1 Tax=Araneus ventricosus TaxID=182803 RepID=A0A4Y2CBP1_ARAVE|nr:hypothetical protein AVEN_218973-1 [Araneus ventricosus]
MEFWDDKRNVRTRSYYLMKHSRTVLTASKIQGTRTTDIVIAYNTHLNRGFDVVMEVILQTIKQCREKFKEFDCVDILPRSGRSQVKDANVDLLRRSFLRNITKSTRCGTWEFENRG